MQKVYITGSAIISALGNNTKEAIDSIKNIDDSNYFTYLKEQFRNMNFYSIKKEFSTQNEKFYSIIENVVKDAIIDANLSKEEIKDLHIFLGSTSMSISINEETNLDFLRNSTSSTIKEIGYGSIGSFVENLVNTKHKSTIIQSACTSSANAFSYATNLIKNKKINKALVIGLEMFNNSTFQGFNSLMLLSPSAKYKPFDKNSDGLILGEACSAVILDSKKISEDNFECLSSNSSFDNHSVTNSNPNGHISFECMKEAITKANISLENITCIKAHAAGSEVSNLSEARAIQNLFAHYSCQTDVTVLKPFLGHTLGSCGTNEIILLCECIKNGFIPKTFGFKHKYEEISFEPLQITKMTNKATVLFNYIGFGGSNSSIILSNER